MERRELSDTVGGNVNWCSHSGEQYGGSLKNRAIIYTALQSHSGHISREKHDPKGYMHPSVHSSIVYNSQDMEATEMSINRGVDKHVVQKYKGILLSHRKECHLQQHGWT